MADQTEAMTESTVAAVKTVEELLNEAEDRSFDEVETHFNESSQDYTVVFGRTWKDLT